MSFDVIAPGILSLLLDSGRLGQHQIGLTSGGPMDPEAFHWANRLCSNASGATAIEISIGGLTLQAQCDSLIALTGAAMPLSINGKKMPSWQTQKIKAGDKISIGFSQDAGSRAYLAVSGGFDIEPQFGSTATVVREGVGGLRGLPLAKGDKIPYIKNPAHSNNPLLVLAEKKRPSYHNKIVVRVIPGYQLQNFSAVKQRLFFSSTYKVSDLCDRMGYRLTGPSVAADIEGILSEGICAGAIQVPADGQPIMLMNDRQTIGGYPKIGSALSLDMAKVAQLSPGGEICFAAINLDDAHQALLLAQRRFEQTQLDIV